MVDFEALAGDLASCAPGNIPETLIKALPALQSARAEGSLLAALSEVYARRHPGEPRSRKMMENLETLAGYHPPSALRLMVELYSLADQEFAHDVADGIDLWIHGQGDGSLADYLEAKLAQESNPYLKKKYGEWLSSIQR